MSGKVLLNLALSNEQTIEVTSESCKRFRYRQNECQVCVDICPEQAITLEVGPVIADCCSQCGLCVNACPTEVFQSNVDMDQYIIDQMRQVYNKQTNPTNSNKISFSCQQACAEDNEFSIKVNCLGNLNENLVLNAALLGFAEMNCYTGNCQQCQYQQGEALFDIAVELADNLMTGLKIKKPSVKKVTQPKGSVNDETLSRRAFFSKIGQHVKQRTASADYVKQNPIETLLNQITSSGVVDKHPSPKRQLLRNLVKQQLNKQQEEEITEQTLAWKKMWVEQEKCVACAICVNVCPTGALVKEIKDDALYRYFSSTACTNCGLCNEACPHNIIHFTDAYMVRDITDDVPYLVARIPLNACLFCGETIPVSEGEICTTCQKRQVSPIFL